MEREPIRRPKFNPELPKAKLPKPEIGRPEMDPNLREVKLPKSEVKRPDLPETKVKRPKLKPELRKVDLSKVNIEGFGKYIKEKIRGKKLLGGGEPGKNLPAEIIKEEKSLTEIGKKETLPEVIKEGSKLPVKRETIEVKGKVIEEEERVKAPEVPEAPPEKPAPETHGSARAGRPERAPGAASGVPEPEIHGSAEAPPEKPAPETPAPEDERRVRRSPVRVEEEDIFGEKVRKKIGAYERESLKKYELSMKEKGAVAGQLGRMSKDVVEDFDLKWYVENRDKVEEANFKFNPSNMEHVKMVVARLGGRNEINRYRPESLITGEELPTYLEKLKQIEALEKDLYKEVAPPDSQALIFNLLQKRAERIKGKIEEAEGSAKKALKKEDKELFEVRKILGKNTTKMFSGEEMKGFWWGTDYPLSEVYPAIGREIISGGKASWNEKMGALAGDLNVAIGFTEAKYAAVKDRAVAEVIEKELKKEKKSGPVLEAIERGFRGMGRDYIPFIDKIVHRRGLEGLTGGWEEDKRLLGDFLEAEGITDFSAERFDASKAALESRRMPYEKAVRQQKGFVDWFLSFIFQFLSSPETERR